LSTVAPKLITDSYAADAQAWERQTLPLRFVFAGCALFAVRWPGLILNAPFTYASVDPSRPPPAPAQFPEGIQALRIRSCPLERASASIALLGTAIRYIPAQYFHCYVQLCGTFEEYLQKFSSKTRWTLRKKLARFLEQTQPDAFQEYREPGSIRQFYALARALSEKTYQQKLLDAGIAHDEGFADELDRKAARGAVRGYLLAHEGSAVSYILCYVHRDTLTVDKMGFDPRFAQLHPGTVLTYLVLRRVFEQQEFRVFDFGSGYYEYKEFFSTGTVRCADIFYLRSTVRNLVVVLAHAGLNRVSEGLKKILDFLGLKARVKKLIHRLA
jgi:CelD/BcsL family acetyltransferase involved in cellulose biosynthesis